AVIGKDGHIKDLKLVDGNALLTGAAQQAVQKWVYKPATYDKAFVKATIEIAVEFKLPHDKETISVTPSTAAPVQPHPSTAPDISAESQDRPIYQVGQSKGAAVLE